MAVTLLWHQVAISILIQICNLFHFDTDFEWNLSASFVLSVSVVSSIHVMVVTLLWATFGGTFLVAQNSLPFYIFLLLLKENLSIMS